MTKNSTPLLVVTAVIAMSAGLWLAQSSKNNQPPLSAPHIQGAIYTSDKPVKPFKLINHLGDDFTNSNLNGHWSIVFVGYTHCPDICPTTLSLMSEVHREMSLQKVNPPNVLFLSIDPERDTPEVMKTYVEYFNPEFTGITGELSNIKTLTQDLNAVYRKAPGLSGEITKDDYLMDHSSALMLINPKGNLQSILTAPHTPGNVIESIIKTQAYYSSAN